MVLKTTLLSKRQNYKEGGANFVAFLEKLNFKIFNLKSCTSFLNSQIWITIISDM